jgi:hypothetical protein
MRYSVVVAMLILLFAAPLAAGTIYFAQVADGGGYVTTITIVNPTSNEATATLKLADDYGTPWPINLTDGRSGSQFFVSVPAMGSTRLISTGVGQTTKTGWAVLDSQADLSGVATFDYRSGSTLMDSVGAMGTPSGKRFLLPVDTSLTADTGFAVANIGTDDVSIKVTLQTENGTISSSAMDSRLNPLFSQRHLAIFVSQIFPSLQSRTFKGSLVIEVVGSGDIAVLGLAFKEGQLSSVPFVALAQSTALTTSQQKAKQLFGQWAFTFTIMEQRTQNYSFTTLVQDVNDPTLWFASGTSLNDLRPVSAGWYADVGKYLMMHENLDFIDVYYFDLTGTNSVSGCYYQKFSDGTVSRCYSMDGTRTSPAPGP